jgi:hypothetical protein
VGRRNRARAWARSNRFDRGTIFDPAIIRLKDMAHPMLLPMLAELPAFEVGIYVGYFEEKTEPFIW